MCQKPAGPFGRFGASTVLKACLVLARQIRCAVPGVAVQDLTLDPAVSVLYSRCFFMAIKTA